MVQAIKDGFSKLFGKKPEPPKAGEPSAADMKKLEQLLGGGAAKNDKTNPIAKAAGPLAASAALGGAAAAKNRKASQEASRAKQKAMHEALPENSKQTADNTVAGAGIYNPTTKQNVGYGLPLDQSFGTKYYLGPEVEVTMDTKTMDNFDPNEYSESHNEKQIHFVGGDGDDNHTLIAKPEDGGVITMFLSPPSTARFFRDKEDKYIIADVSYTDPKTGLAKEDFIAFPKELTDNVVVQNEALNSKNPKVYPINLNAAFYASDVDMKREPVKPFEQRITRTAYTEHLLENYDPTKNKIVLEKQQDGDVPAIPVPKLIANHTAQTKIVDYPQATVDDLLKSPLTKSLSPQDIKDLGLETGSQEGVNLIPITEHQTVEIGDGYILKRPLAFKLSPDADPIIFDADWPIDKLFFEKELMPWAEENPEKILCGRSYLESGTEEQLKLDKSIVSAADLITVSDKYDKKTGSITYVLPQTGSDESQKVKTLFVDQRDGKPSLNNIADIDAIKTMVSPNQGAELPSTKEFLSTVKNLAKKASKKTGTTVTGSKVHFNSANKDGENGELVTAGATKRPWYKGLFGGEG